MVRPVVCWASMLAFFGTVVVPAAAQPAPGPVAQIASPTMSGPWLPGPTNDTRATYEGNATAAGEQNTWHQEYYRAECEDGSVTVGSDQIVRIHRHTRGQGVVTQEVRAPLPRHEGHAWIVSEFLDWLDDGPLPATALDDNMRTAAMIFGAIESARTRQTVDVEDMLKKAVAGERAALETR